MKCSIHVKHITNWLGKSIFFSFFLFKRGYTKLKGKMEKGRTSAWYSNFSLEVSAASFSATAAALHRSANWWFLLSYFHFNPEEEKRFLRPFCGTKAVVRFKTLFLLLFLSKNEEDEGCEAREAVDRLLLSTRAIENPFLLNSNSQLSTNLTQWSTNDLIFLSFLHT